MEERKIAFHKRFLQRKRNRVILYTVAVLIAIRLALPYVILHYANRELSELSGYRGHIEDVDLALIRGAYTLDDIFLDKKDTVTGEETDFFKADRVDLSVEWGSLFKGKIAGEIKLINPELTFTKEKTPPAEVSEDTTNFREVIKDLMPLDINRFEVRDGIVKYIDKSSKPKVDIALKDVQVLAENLSNEESEELLPASAEASASIYGGSVHVNLKMNPMAKTTTFDMNAEVNGIQLPQLNDFFRAYGKLDVQQGTFGLYTEAAAKNGRFVGYVKPVIRNFELHGAEDKDDKVLNKLWEAIAGFSVEVLSNQMHHDQLATKIPFEGKIEKPQTAVWYAAVNVLRNAFVQALKPHIDNEINIRNVKTEEKFYDKIFDRKEKKKEDRKSEKKEEKKQKNGGGEEGKRKNGTGNDKK